MWDGWPQQGKQVVVGGGCECLWIYAAWSPRDEVVQSCWRSPGIASPLGFALEMLLDIGDALSECRVRDRGLVLESGIIGGGHGCWLVVHC